MAVSAADQSHIVELLTADVRATIGEQQSNLPRTIAEDIAKWNPLDDPVSFAEKVTEELQQYFHDCFVDTAWPSCPRHPGTHPLWFHDGWWCCERDGAR